MLKSLHIRNYVLIESLHVNFNKGFVAITGETGSGKSILLDAFALLLGDRSDVKSIRVGQEKCTVEAVFGISKERFDSFFQEHDLDFSEETVVRREVNNKGKSRAFINDTPVTLNVLKQFTEQLVDLHSQHENALLFRKAFRYEMVDAFSKSKEVWTSYKSSFLQWRQTQEELDNLRVQLNKEKATEDYRLFQLNELTQEDFSSYDVAEMESELNLQQNSGELLESLHAVSTMLSEGDSNVLQQLKIAKQQLMRWEGGHAKLQEFSSQLESVIAELREVDIDLQRFSDSVTIDPERAASIEERLSFVFKMFRKHNVNSIDALNELKLKLEQDAQLTETLEASIQNKEIEVVQLEQRCKELATKLSHLRMKGVKEAEKAISSSLNKLNLTHAQFQIEVTGTPELHLYGAENLRFAFSANKGQPFEDIKSVASGGEISRVMLAIKAATAHLNEMPVLILDEIDQGVGGETGNRIAALLREMSASAQLLVITHLPQIASKAHQHFRVSKRVEEDTTVSDLKELSVSEREKEVAHMLGGDQAGAAALQTAKELMQQEA
jgi:DNA repair protein RecN (Recombination protein N)